MPNSKKFLDANGLTYFASKLDNYPTNEVLGTVINAIDGEIEELQSYHLTESKIEDIIEDLYPEATAEEIEDMVEEVLDSLSTVKEDIVETILSSNESSGDSSIYAPLASPAFTGTPTAPTAAYGTNNTQIATTAFVQEAIHPMIIVTIDNIPENTLITVTATLINSSPTYTASATLNSSGIAYLALNQLGDYSISFNNPLVRCATSTLSVPIPNLYSVNGYFFEEVTYTVNIDKTNSNPLTCCTYADDALGMTKGSVDWNNCPIFKDIRPCVFKNGQVQYYLNPNNFNEKYGTGEASDLTGADGDVMIEFPKFAYKIKTTNNTITVSVSNDISIIENDSDYTYDAFSRLSEGDRDYFYKGAFKGWIDENHKLRSLPGKEPVRSVTQYNFRLYARNNGAHYQQSTFAQLKAIQCLYLIKYGNLNSQQALGRGVVNNSAPCLTGYNTISVESINESTSTLELGMNFGTTANSTTHMRLFGLEDFWGNKWEWVDGFATDAQYNIITSWNNFNGESGVTQTTETTPGAITEDSSGYISDVIGNTAVGFIPASFIGGSSSTYWSDNGSFFKSCILRQGGANAYEDEVGIFGVNIKNGSDSSRADTGGRLSYV